VKPPVKNYRPDSSFPEVLTSSTLWQKLSVVARRRFRSVTEEHDLHELCESFFLITLLACGMCAGSWKQQGISYTSHLAGAMWMLVQEKPFLAYVWSCNNCPSAQIFTLKTCSFLGYWLCQYQLEPRCWRFSSQGKFTARFFLLPSRLVLILSAVVFKYQLWWMFLWGLCVWSLLGFTSR